MADTTTANLGLLIADLNDVFNFGAHVEANLTTIDGLMGAVQCTSTARPTNTYAGQIIYETDSLRYAQNTGTKSVPAWTYMSHAALVCTSTTRPTVGLSTGQIIYETDTGSFAVNAGSGTWRYRNIFPCTSSTRPTAIGTGAMIYETDTKRVLVNNAGTWENKAFAAFVCTSSTHPASPFQGLQIYETDTGRSLVYNGSNYVPVGQQLMATPTATSSTGTATSGTTETFDAVLGYHAASLVSGRRYQVTLNGLIGNGSVVADNFTIQIRDSQSASNPTAASTQIAMSEWYVSATGSAGRGSISVGQSFLCTVTGTHTFGVSATRLAGTGVFTPVGTRELFVEDMGVAL